MRTVLLLAAVCLPLAADVVRSPSGNGGASCASRPCTFAVNCARGCIASEIQAALNEAQRGDTITLEAGKTWDIASSLILYRKTTGSGVLTVRTSMPDSQLPEANTRITPVWAGVLPTLRANLASSRVITVEQTTNPVEDYQFIGLHITASDVADFNDLIRMWAAGIHTSAAYTPNRITFDRCIIRGHPLRSASKGIRMHVRNGVIKNSFFDEFKGYADAQAVSNFNGPGPMLIQNNYMSASGENFMTGGAKPDIPGLVPANHIIEFNAFVKDPAQLMLEPWKPGMFVRAGKVVTAGRGRYKALDSGVTGQTTPQFPVTTVNRMPVHPLKPGFSRGDDRPDYACSSEFCVTDNGIRWQLIYVTPNPWRPNLTVLEGDLITYTGPETQNKSVEFYASQGGVTGMTPPFRLPTPALNPSPASCSGNYCVTDGTVRWQTYTLPAEWYINKNIFELKVMNGALIRWNYLSGSWTDGQVGWGFNLKPENQDPANTWTARTENLEIAYNIITDVERPFSFQGKSSSGTGLSRNWNIHDNLIYNLRPSAAPVSHIVVSNDVYQLRFVHNTMKNAPGHYIMSSSGTQGDGLVMTDNVLQRGSNGWKRSSTPEGTPSLGSTFRSYTFTKNLVEGAPLSSYPPGNYDYSWSTAGLMNAAAEDFRLTPSSPLKNAGTDGKDLGADIEQLPSIRNFAVTASDRAALFTYELGPANAEIPCVVEVSTKQDLSTFIPDLDPAQFVRPDSDRNEAHIVGADSRMLRIGKNVPLQPSTFYWYRLHCGGELRTGSFQTAAPAGGTRQLKLTATQGAGADRASFEYGYSYSRSSNRITSAANSSTVMCQPGAPCSATVNATRGQVLYFRLVSKKSSAVTGYGPYSALIVD